MLLALLILVAGRLGGPLGGPLALPFDVDLLIGGGAAKLAPSDCISGELMTETEAARCGDTLGLEAEAIDGFGGPLVVRGGPARGGGGVPLDCSGVLSFAAFLLIHLFN
jgi:hypothetical protein